MKVLLIDFDGTISSYRSGFIADNQIPDPPVDGAVDSIARLRQRFKVIVFSARARSVEGRNAIISWLAKYGVEVDGVTDKKIPAFCQIDDTSIKFEGNWTETMKKINTFYTWLDLENLSGKEMKPVDDLKDELKSEEVNLDGMFK